MVDEIERTEKRAALLTRLANAKRKQAEAQLQYDAASSGSAADPMVTPASSQGAGVASTAAGSGGGSGNSGSGAGSGAGGGGGGGAAAGRRRSTPRLCELGFSQFGNSALKAGPGKFIAHEGDLKTFIKLEISDEDQVLVQFEEGASRVVLGSRSGVVDELLSCIINATNSQEACSLLRAGVRLIKKHVKEDIDNAPSLVNESIGVLAVAPNAKAIAGTMVSTVLGGSGVDTRQCSSVYFKPLIKLACSYFVLLAAYGEDATITPQMLGYEGERALGGSRAAAAGHDRAAPDEAAPRWVGVTEYLRAAVLDQVRIVGEQLPPRTSHFPHLTDRDFKTIAKNGWADLKNAVECAGEHAKSEDTAALALTYDQWRNAPEFKSYVQTRWGKLGEHKDKHLNKEEQQVAVAAP